MANFALIGAAGYIAPRHIKAIADTGNNLVAAYDKFDSVGRLDASFPECSFFTEQEQFDRFCSKRMRTEDPLHWLSICTPNYLHDAHTRYGLRLGAESEHDLGGCVVGEAVHGGSPSDADSDCAFTVAKTRAGTGPTRADVTLLSGGRVL